MESINSSSVELCVVTLKGTPRFNHIAEQGLVSSVNLEILTFEINKWYGTVVSAQVHNPNKGKGIVLDVVVDDRSVTVSIGYLWCCATSTGLPFSIEAAQWFV